MDLMKCLADWQAKDDARESVRGEHAMVAAAGGALIVAALFDRGGISGTVKALLGGALLVRAASGRDGIACWSRCASGSSKSRDGAEDKAAAGRQPAWDFPKSPVQAPGGE